MVSFLFLQYDGAKLHLQLRKLMKMRGKDDQAIVVVGFPFFYLLFHVLSNLIIAQMIFLVNFEID